MLIVHSPCCRNNRHYTINIWLNKRQKCACVHTYAYMSKGAMLIVLRIYVQGVCSWSCFIRKPVYRDIRNLPDSSQTQNLVSLTSEATVTTTHGSRLNNPTFCSIWPPYIHLCPLPRACKVLSASFCCCPWKYSNCFQMS